MRKRLPWVDGIRRHILAGGSLDAQVAKAMNPNPLSADEGAPGGYIKDLMRRGNVVAIPLLDQDHIIEEYFSNGDEFEIEICSTMRTAQTLQ